MNPTDKRIFAIATAFHRGYSVEKIWQMTNIDKWFLTKLQSSDTARTGRAETQISPRLFALGRIAVFR